jgi:hypothetical protein
MKTKIYTWILKNNDLEIYTASWMISLGSITQKNEVKTQKL